MLVNITGSSEKIKAYNQFLETFNKENENDDSLEKLEPVSSLDDVFCPYGEWINILDKDEETRDMSRICDTRNDFTGVYVSSNPNTHLELPTFTDYKTDNSIYGGNETTPLLMCEYGVCDNASQVLEVYDRIVAESVSDEAKEQMSGEFIIRLTPVFSKYNEGWRWHKWGGYIGVQNPECEYIGDETNIDMVYAFHIYRIIKENN